MVDMSNLKPKIIVVLGPTASGKTSLGIHLAKKFNGEIISADSRSVYKKMDIGTAKPNGEWRTVNGESAYYVQGVPHYCMDVVDPGEEWSLASFKVLALESIDQILKRGKLPIVVGGTGLYIDSIIKNFEIPKVEPNKKLRTSLAQKKLPELVLLLEQLDPKALEVVDLKNERRVLRALEVVILTGKSFALQRKMLPAKFNPLIIGLGFSLSELKTRIYTRIDEQIKDGLVDEVRALLKQSYGLNLPSMSGIGYKEIFAYLKEEITKEEAIRQFKRATVQFAKRQITWFKRDKRIVWLDSEKVINDSERMVEEFLENAVIRTEP
jgi:tRNA dimethylallyltransferase